MEIIHLDPRQKLLREIADFLMTEVREDLGAQSLAHLLVIVPTAESGRRLRLELARRFPRGLVPPTLQLPAQVLKPDPSPELASRADELLAMHAARGSQDANFELSAQLVDIRRVLGAKALSFADVARFLETSAVDLGIPENEVTRWQELAQLETKYLSQLQERKVADRIMVTQAAIASPQVPPGIEKVVVAAVLDPLPAFSLWLENLKLPGVRLEPDFRQGLKIPERTQVVQTATPADAAERAAQLFASVKANEAYPALCLADSELYPEFRSTFKARGLKVHNPAMTKVATSSLGQLVRQISALKRASSYKVFSAFVRSGDVRRYLMRQINFRKGVDPDAAWAEAMTQLDKLQAKLLPERIEDIAPKAEHTLRAIFDLVDALLRKHDLRGVLRDIFSEYLLEEQNPAAREFAAAAETVNALIDEVEPLNLNARLKEELFARRLEESTYSLEPDAGDLIVTDGWLELPYLDTEELWIAGFNEGTVPEAVVGHPFLPDSLRRALGLPDNQQRTERDARILSLALSCRPTAAVHLSFHSLNAAGDQLKPSRLLFAGVDDRELAARAKAFYEINAGTLEGLSADLPEAWRLKLPIPPARQKLERTSPSALNDYLKCPLTYYLRKCFGEHENDRAEELDASEFGSVAHEALERWGASEFRNSEDAEQIAAELAKHVEAILAERFATQVPAIVHLQAESIKSRLRHFAAIQAQRRREGWEVMATERKLRVVYGHTAVCGKCDRVDYRPSTDEWCVIDYKTFDLLSKAAAYDAKKHVWLSLQLPLYVAMLDADQAEFKAARRERTISAYCVLGQTREEVAFSAPIPGELVSDAEQKVRELIDRIERGIFWPATPANAWQYDFKNWIFNTPEMSVDGEWIRDQEARLVQLEEELHHD